MPIAAAGTFRIAALGDREIVMTREFDAPRPLVFDAFTKPELVCRWLLGPPGWSMPVCEIDLTVPPPDHAKGRSSLVEGFKLPRSAARAP